METFQAVSKKMTKNCNSSAQNGAAALVLSFKKKHAQDTF